MSLNMKGFITQHLLLLAIGRAIIPLADAGNPQPMCGFVDRALATPSVNVSIMKRQKFCFNLCLFHPDCKSTNYNFTNQLCALNNISHLDSSVELTIMPGMFYAFSESQVDCSMPQTEMSINLTDCTKTWTEHELSVVGKPSTLSSMFIHDRFSYVAGRANDGDPNADMHTSPHCSHTKEELHPWWRVDLGGKHWLGNITIVNRKDCCEKRMTGATVRAGLSPNISENMICGTAVTPAQSQKGAWIEFVCDPLTRARFVSVDINTGTPEILQLCEVMVREYIMVKNCQEY